MSFIVRSLPTLTLGSAVMMASCGVDPGDAEAPTDMPLLSSLAGPSGATGSNGLSTLSWALYKNVLHVEPIAARAELDGERTRDRPHEFEYNAPREPERAGGAQYAARCGLNDGDWVTAESPSQNVPGERALDDDRRVENVGALQTPARRPI